MGNALAAVIGMHENAGQPRGEILALMIVAGPQAGRPPGDRRRSSSTSGDRRSAGCIGRSAAGCAPAFRRAVSPTGRRPAAHTSANCGHPTAE
ncbi:hypothetical protein M8494_21520 [Serratia ureilytica]